MVTRQLHFHCSKQAFARRGDESYEAQLYPKVEAGNHEGLLRSTQPVGIEGTIKPSFYQTKSF
jgi:hypothetical protein